MPARRGCSGEAFETVGEVAHEGAGDPTPVPGNVRRTQIPVWQPALWWGLLEAGDDVRDELYDGELLALSCTVERGSF
jgi:hypothetical protein